MTEVFRDSHLKVKRAQRHLAELERISQEWSDSTKFGKQLGPDASHWAVQLGPPPEDAGSIVGDVVHNLRAALDLMAVALVRAKGGNTKNVYFPFAGSQSALAAQIKGKNFDRAGPDAVTLLEQIGPYRGGNDALRELHDLDIQDKHHTLIPHSTTFKTAAMRVNVDAEGKVALVPVEDSKASASLAFPEDSVFANQEIVPVLRQLVAEVTQTIAAFERLCVDREAKPAPE